MHFILKMKGIVKKKSHKKNANQQKKCPWQSANVI